MTISATGSGGFDAAAVNSGMTLIKSILALERGERLLYWVGCLANDAELDLMVRGRRSIAQELERRGVVLLTQMRSPRVGGNGEGVAATAYEYSYYATRTKKAAAYSASEVFRAATDAVELKA